MKNTKAYGTIAATASLALIQIDRRELRPHDVEIEILYCGVCHSDLHTARNDWKGTKYPVVPGHEIIGHIIVVGSAVSRFTIGENVGVGCMVDSCQQCTSCQKGEEQYCKQGATFTYNSIDRHDKTQTHGGYSETIVVSEKFVVHIPEGLDLKGAAPLLCAGITTWSPLRHWNAGSGSNVGVIGLGGLGHMAIKLGKAMGANVSLFTRSTNKIEDARRLGAANVILSTDAGQMKSVKGQFDLIIDTVPNVHDVNQYIPALSTNGTLVLVGYLGELEPMLDTVPMIMGRKSVAGSVIGGISETQEMLDFCGKHGIVSDIEMINIQEINDAYERLIKSDVKYRFVIDMASLKK